MIAKYFLGTKGAIPIYWRSCIYFPEFMHRERKSENPYIRSSSSGHVLNPRKPTRLELIFSSAGVASKGLAPRPARGLGPEGGGGGGAGVPRLRARARGLDCGRGKGDTATGWVPVCSRWTWGSRARPHGARSAPLHPPGGRGPSGEVKGRRPRPRPEAGMVSPVRGCTRGSAKVAAGTRTLGAAAPRLPAPVSDPQPRSPPPPSHRPGPGRVRPLPADRARTCPRQARREAGRRPRAEEGPRGARGRGDGGRRCGASASRPRRARWAAADRRPGAGRPGRRGGGRTLPAASARPGSPASSSGSIHSRGPASSPAPRRVRGECAARAGGAAGGGQALPSGSGPGRPAPPGQRPRPSPAGSARRRPTPASGARDSRPGGGRREQRGRVAPRCVGATILWGCPLPLPCSPEAVGSRLRPLTPPKAPRPEPLRSRGPRPAQV